MPSDARPDRASGRTAAIRMYPDGPLVVRGTFTLLDEAGDPIDARRRTISLCRCGRTRIAPFCDGSHARGRAEVE